MSKAAERYSQTSAEEKKRAAALRLKCHWKLVANTVTQRPSETCPFLQISPKRSWSSLLEFPECFGAARRPETHTPRQKFGDVYISLLFLYVNVHVCRCLCYQLKPRLVYL